MTKFLTLSGREVETIEEWEDAVLVERMTNVVAALEALYGTPCVDTPEEIAREIQETRDNARGYCRV